LGNIKDPRAVEPLIAILKGTNSSDRINAIKALGIIKDPRAVEPLIVAMKDPNGNVQLSAAEALGKYGEPAVEPLIAVLKDSDPNARRNAAYALGEIDDPRAVSTLLEAWKERDFTVIVGADSFFIKRGEPGSEDVLIEALDEFGDRAMAHDLLSCGNAKLEGAVRVWAQKHGYQIITMPFGRSTQWGSKR
jgi:HEAT repeat protein